MDTARTLVTSYCFPPYSDTAGIVAAKRVLEAGRPVDVICNAMDAIRRRDHSLTAIGGDLVRRFHPVPSPSAFSSWPSIDAFADLGYRVALTWEREQAPYDKLYSRAQFAASHFLAARYKLAHPGVQWTAEFSDPLSHDVLGKVRTSPWQEGFLSHLLRTGIEQAGFCAPTDPNALLWCETSTFALADRFLFTNERQRDFMLERCPDPALADRVGQRAVVSPHPTLPRRFYSMVSSGYELPADRVNIGYFGNFYANRGTGLLLDALATAPSAVTDRVLVHIFTSKPAGLIEAVRAKGVSTSVRVNPYVDYLEFLNLTDRMDLLLVNDAVTPPAGTVNPFLPSKWSDYKGSTTPVWAVIEEDSPLDSQPGIAYRTPVEHLSGLQAVLADVAEHGVTSEAPANAALSSAMEVTTAA